ncbi:metallophosphoesterase family protein [Halalkalibacter okhensis]|uniref:Metallophosphoesterase n=1 Tax=Halalkalibacter okhensis TaxID=333138 RepID=A0A0B0IFY5_9BACI|nr:metallophosphoesterase [Halalkalibacter okhensis]KHF38586.1 metallophosphoesterase [Halalkalibacter okhensis]
MKLVLMGDLHYSAIDETIEGLYEARSTFYKTYLEKFLEIDGDAHISLGDLTNYGLTLELEGVYDILNQRERRFIHVLGNHDLYAQPRSNVLEITGQARYHSITTDEAVCVFLDTAKEMDYEDWGGWIDDEQLAWFEEVVKESGTKPLFVFAHHPVYQTTKNSDLEKGSIHPSIDMWNILNQKQGQGFYFNGHTHHDSIVKQQNWTFVQLSAALDQHCFRIVELDQEEINITAVEVTDEAMVNSALILHQHMNHFTHQPNARGSESDRECRASIVSVTGLEA